MKNFKYSKIDEIIKVAKKGKIFILVDDKNRENEGDLVFSAKKTTAKKINFMAKHGRGLICLALDKKQTNKLGLSLMPSRNSSRLRTAFTVSIEARRGVTTGISALDRAKTILVAINQKSNSKSLSTPGHIFPLVARDGGVLTRAGHLSFDVVSILTLKKQKTKTHHSGHHHVSGAGCSLYKQVGHISVFAVHLFLQMFLLSGSAKLCLFHEKKNPNSLRLIFGF